MDEKVMSQLDAELEQTLTRKYDIEPTMYFEAGALLKPLPPLISVPLWGDIDMRGRLPQGK